MKKQIDWQRMVVHAGALVTLGILVLRYFTNTLSVNPIQTLEIQTGKTALIFLMLSLACSPLSTILDWRSLGKRKKALGLYGFMFASIHLLIYIGLDFGFRIGLVLQTLKFSVFIWFGLAAFVMLFALAITSLKKMKKLLKKYWKPLHRLVYIISPIVVVHFMLSLKGSILRLQGNIREPIIYGSIVLVLLILRIPPVRQALVNLRVKLTDRPKRTNPL